jgi:hypothetical protein
LRRPVPVASMNRQSPTMHSSRSSRSERLMVTATARQRAAPRRDCVRLSTWASRRRPPGTSGQGQTHARPICMFIHRRPRGYRPLLPRGGQSPVRTARAES